jgi:hypothetical protein
MRHRGDLGLAVSTLARCLVSFSQAPRAMGTRMRIVTGAMFIALAIDSVFVRNQRTKESELSYVCPPGGYMAVQLFKNVHIANRRCPNLLCGLTRINKKNVTKTE